MPAWRRVSTAVFDAAGGASLAYLYPVNINITPTKLEAIPITVWFVGGKSENSPNIKPNRPRATMRVPPKKRVVNNFMLLY